MERTRKKRKEKKEIMLGIAWNISLQTLPLQNYLACKNILDYLKNFLKVNNVKSFKNKDKIYTDERLKKSIFLSL